MADVNTPQVSVLLSCYNGSQWIRESIQSVLDQTYRDFEFIIVDDGSTDDSLDIINDFAKRDRRIRVIEKNNTGLADSLNVGLENARSAWIARIDADDICEPNRLKKQIDIVNRYPGLVFLGSAISLIDDKGDNVGVYKYPTRHNSLLNNLRSLGRFPAHSSAFIRANVMRSVGGYRVRFERSQDWDLWLRLSEKGRLMSLSEPLVRVRKHSQQISHKELGKSQVIYSRIATISYWLRRWGYSDPIEYREGEYERFYNWVASRLSGEQVFDYLYYISESKKMVRQLGGSPECFVGSVFYILSEKRYLLRFMLSRLFGESISRRLAGEWIENNRLEKIKLRWNDDKNREI